MTISLSELDAHDIDILAKLFANAGGLGINQLSKDVASKVTVISHLRKLREYGIVEQVSPLTRKDMKIHRLTRQGIALATKIESHKYIGYIADKWIQKCEEKGYDDFHFLSDFTGKEGHKALLVAVNQKVRDVKIVQLFKPSSIQYYGYNPRKEGGAPNSFNDFVRRHVKDFSNSQQLRKAISDFFLNREYYGAIVVRGVPEEPAELGIPPELGKWEAFTFLGLGYQEDLPDVTPTWDVAIVKVPETPFKVQLTAELNIQVIKEILKKLFKENKAPSNEDLFEALHLGSKMAGKFISIAKCENASRSGDMNYCSRLKRDCGPISGGLPKDCPYLPSSMIQQIEKKTEPKEVASSKAIEVESRVFVSKNDDLKKVLVIVSVKLFDKEIRFSLNTSDLSHIKNAESLIDQGYTLSEEMP